MIKRILTAIILLAAITLSAFFTSLNPGEIRLDLGFITIATPLGLAFVGALAVGWLLGIFSALTWIARVSADRRRLRAELKNASPAAFPVRDERS